MTIATLNDFIASTKQVVPISKTTTRTTVANVWFGLMDVAGNPGAGVLAGTNATAGVVPTDATAGFPAITFSSGTGYLACVDFTNTVASRMMVGDMLFKMGTFTYTAGTATMTSANVGTSRIPGGTDYHGLQIWLEVVTAFTSAATWSLIVQYTDQDGNTGAVTTTTGSLAAAALTIGKRLQLALASGDSGVSAIEKVIVSNGSAVAGSFNILVIRPLWGARVNAINGGDTHGIDRTGMPIVYADSALDFMVAADSTSSGQPDIQLDIVNL